MCFPPGRRRSPQRPTVSSVMETSSKTDSDLAGGATGLTSVIADNPNPPAPNTAARAPSRRRPVRPMKQFVPLTLAAALAAPAAHAQVAGDPAGSSPLLGALTWVQGTLLGNLATTAAVIAVAIIGYLMLTGRFEWRRGLVVLVGIFVIFGAVSIVAGLRSLAGAL